jgi:hypothetical protein
MPSVEGRYTHLPVTSTAGELGTLALSDVAPSTHLPADFNTPMLIRAFFWMSHLSSSTEEVKGENDAVEAETLASYDVLGCSLLAS